jgi:pilus assembly protein CpaC
MMPIGVPQTPAPLPASTEVPGLPAAQTRMVQNPGEYDKPLPRQIDRLPSATEKLEVIHRRSQLVVTRQRVMRFAIADPSIIDIIQYSPTELSIVGLGLGSTNLLYWFEGDIEPLIYEVNVVPDPALEEQRRIDYGRLERKIAILFPNSKVYLIPLSGKIVVKGQARDGEEAAHILEIIRGEIINQDGRLGGPQPLVTQDQLNAGLGLGAAFDVASTLIVNMLDVPGEYQVMLRVRIAEISRSQLRRMGCDLAGLLNDGRHFVSSTLGGVGGALTGIFEQGEASVLLNWLESNGSAKILSEPTLTVLSGHAASFLSGAEFAVPTIVGIGGAQGQTTTFRGFGTSILVTPTVIDRDLIRMRIVPEFSEANTNLTVGGIPGLNSRRVQTTVELREGQTIAIAGLISHQTNVEVTRIPFLGEIPHIGPLIFNTKRAAQDETELLVLVTPELVRPMDADEVPPVPGYEVTPPSQWELYHAAMVEGAPDTSYYQVPPLGSDSNHGINVPYRLYNPVPSDPQYAPIPNNTFGAVPCGSTMDSSPSMQPYGNPGGFVPAPPAAAPNQYYPTGQPHTTWQQGQSAHQRVMPAGYHPAARRTTSNPVSGWFR